MESGLSVQMKSTKENLRMCICFVSSSVCGKAFAISSNSEMRSNSVFDTEIKCPHCGAWNVLHSAEQRAKEAITNNSSYEEITRIFSEIEEGTRKSVVSKMLVANTDIVPVKLEKRKYYKLVVYVRSSCPGRLGERELLVSIPFAACTTSHEDLCKLAREMKDCFKSAANEGDTLVFKQKEFEETVAIKSKTTETVVPGSTKELSCYQLAI